MPCYYPVNAWRSKIVNPSGKRSIVFNPIDSNDESLVLPCSRCIGCRLERSRQWAMRCVHEASLHSQNCFITLTYSPEHFPEFGSLNKDDFVLFMKRLRHKFGEGIRFYMCGEYGERLGRPHYHAILFNFDFPDRSLWSVRDGVKLYTSKLLSELWPFGFSTIGDVTFESAAYTARYIMKKQTGDRAVSYLVLGDFGEILGERLPEYNNMSRRPGIGRQWFEKFKGDVFPKDFITMRGVKMRAPKFYDRIFDVDNPDDFEDVKLRRKFRACEESHNSTWERLRVREEIQLRRIEQLKRGLENG